MGKVSSGISSVRISKFLDGLNAVLRFV